MLLSQHIYLACMWLLFGLVHSVFASGSVKRKAEVMLKQYYKFYRISYSVVSIVILCFVVWYHFYIYSIFLWSKSNAEIVIAALVGAAGITIMITCVKKYFLNVTGINLLLKREPVKDLQITGLHKFVRHPLYTGTLLFVWGIFLWQPLLSNLISCICITIYTRLGIYFEEKKLVKEFGQPYVTYSQKTPMLIPNFF